eukprot:gb/GFBE01039646.1/.p1 GENE.gb/GFBE01039646.1/~~gb/GFBE01039646.1/.p1  ORF type:complete len:229 (+),score=50.77 gb/GFBE01039646.1/:1-687(+)
MAERPELPTGSQELAPGFEHLQWLCPKDRQVLCRAECAAALKEESRLLADMEATIVAHQRAIEHCRASSETDPSWFTLDVQNCHAKHATLLRDMVQELERSAAPIPDSAGFADGIRGRLYSSYAQTAQATVKAATGIGENEQVQAVAASAMSSAISAFDSLSTALAHAGERRGAGGAQQSPNDSEVAEASAAVPQQAAQAAAAPAGSDAAAPSTAAAAADEAAPASSS